MGHLLRRGSDHLARAALFNGVRDFRAGKAGPWRSHLAWLLRTADCLHGDPCAIKGEPANLTIIETKLTAWAVDCAHASCETWSYFHIPFVMQRRGLTGNPPLSTEFRGFVPCILSDIVGLGMSAITRLSFFSSWARSMGLCSMMWGHSCRIFALTGGFGAPSQDVARLLVHSVSDLVGVC